MLDAIQKKLAVANDPASDIAQLEIETKPEDVLAEIQRLQDRVRQHPARTTD
jgi:hypothetical protein